MKIDGMQSYKYSFDSPNHTLLFSKLNTVFIFVHLVNLKKKIHVYAYAAEITSYSDKLYVVNYKTSHELK